MPKRKLNNVTQRSDGRWMARKTFGYHPDGRPNRKTFYADTAAEAAQKLADYERQLESGLSVDAENFTFEKWLGLWLREYKFHTMRPQTYDGYEGFVNSRIIPTLGRYKLRALRPEHIQQFLNSLKMAPPKNGTEKSGLSTSTITKIKNIVSGALAQAVKNGLITRNPADAVTIPKSTKRNISAFTILEQVALLSQLNGHRLYALFFTALGTGLRRGELLALCWSDVDTSKQEIAVKLSVTRSKDREPNGSLDATGTAQSSIKVGNVKSDAGYRTVPLTDEVMQALQTHQKDQAAERLRAGAAWSNNNLIFCTALGGYLEPRNVARLFETTRNKAGIPRLPFHAMRHTFATNAIVAGMDYYYLSQIMGHANISITLDTYTDSMPDKSRLEMKKLEGVLLNRA